MLTWNISSAQPTRSIPIDTAYGVQLNHNSSRAYVTNPSEGTLTTWDLDGLASYLRLSQALPGRTHLQGGFFRPAGDGVHVASYTNHLSLVNERSGQVSVAHDARRWDIFTPGSWRPDGRRFALGTEDGHVQVFDDLGRLRTEKRVARTTVTDVDYTADGENVAVADLSGRVALLNASTWSAAGKPVQLRGPVAGVTLARDGRTAFVVTRTRAVSPATDPAFEGWALLDLTTGSVLRTGYLPETSWLFDDFSPDGARVGVAFASGRVWILDTRTGRAVDAPAPTHRARIFWLGWSPDGSQILSADGGGTLELWDARTDTVLNTVTVPGNWFVAGQFRPGTPDVTILDSSGRVLIWDTRPEHALDFACRTAGRDLTADEWRTYIGTGPQFPVCPS